MCISAVICSASTGCIDASCRLLLTLYAVHCMHARAQGHLMTADDRTGMVFEVVKNSDETYHVAPKHVSTTANATTFILYNSYCTASIVRSNVQITLLLCIASDHSCYMRN
jgi:hypothetical protein